MTTVIKAENLGKKYIIRHKQDPYDKFADVLVKPFKYTGQKLAQPFTKKSVRFASAKEEFWALKDVSFEIKQGDRVGIIGRNGAGKSTLLKLINRITEPTTGKISIRGRVSSLLEVGTGFHPELTGRENIYLNGAVLGMTRKEIKRKFDEIVAFAEVEKFLDTPVKRYSSGMYVRLAFAVAAHLEPEILIVDEVLAVGDTAFQKKCLGKMQEVGQEGRTVLFVSHNMGAITTLCSKGFLLVSGIVEHYGGMKDAISKYFSYWSKSGKSEYVVNKIDKNKKAQVISAQLLKNGISCSSYNNSDVLTLQMDVAVRQKIFGMQVGYELWKADDVCVFCSTSQDMDCEKEYFLPGIYTFKTNLKLSYIRDSKYFLKISVTIPNIEILDVVSNFLMLDVFDDSSPELKLHEGRKGIILPVYEWEKFVKNAN